MNLLSNHVLKPYNSTGNIGEYSTLLVLEYN